MPIGLRRRHGPCDRGRHGGPRGFRAAGARPAGKVALYEAAGQAGGRCRSYFDETLGCRLDNGNHLLVSGNTAAMAYIAETNAAATFKTADMRRFPFLDIKSCGTLVGAADGRARTLVAVRARAARRRDRGTGLSRCPEARPRR